MIDSHIHLSSYYNNSDEILRALKRHNVECVINVATDLSTSKIAINLSRKFPKKSFATVGTHPEEIKTDIDLEVLNQVEELIQDEVVVAVGEVGLDKTCIKDEKEFVWQKNWLDAQVQLAKNHKLPVILHSRQTTKEMLKTIQLFNNQAKFVWHCFTENEKVAQQVIDSGGYISFTGIITYKSAENLLEVIKYVPSDRYMLETDGPFLTPEPLRKQGVKVNMPWNVYYIAEKIAQIKNETVDSVIKQTTANSRRFFQI